MARSPVSVFSRLSTDGTRRFYARFRDEEGVLVSTRRLKATTRAKAALEAAGLLDEGAASGADNPLVSDFLLGFWSPTSLYARGRALRGHPLSVRYVDENRRVLVKHFLPRLEGVRLRRLTAARLERLLVQLAEEGVPPRTINYGLQAVRVAVAWSARQHRLPDPLQGVEKLAERHRVRGALTVDELRRIVDLDESPRIRAACLLGALCGLRLGEVRGLTWADVDKEDGLLHVVGNFVDEREGRKGPKAGSARDVPLPGAVLDSLRLCRAMAPEAAYLVFNERTPERPTEINTIRRGLLRVLQKIGISEEERKARGLCFHALRHSFVSFSRAQGLPDFVTMRLAGHRTSSMMDRYSHGDALDFPAALEAMERVVAFVPPAAAGA